MLESSSLLVGDQLFSARLMAGIGATGQRNRPARNDRPPRSAEEGKTESVMISRSIPRSANSPRILVVSLVLHCVATPFSLGHPPTQAGHAGKFPVGVLTSKGNLQLTGRGRLGAGRRIRAAHGLRRNQDPSQKRQSRTGTSDGRTAQSLPGHRLDGSAAAISLPLHPCTAAGWPTIFPAPRETSS